MSQVAGDHAPACPAQRVAQLSLTSRCDGQRPRTGSAGQPAVVQAVGTQQRTYPPGDMRSTLAPIHAGPAQRPARSPAPCATPCAFKSHAEAREHGARSISQPTALFVIEHDGTFLEARRTARFNPG